MPLKITSITATYNREKFLPRCLESVAQEEYSAKEHVVVDGASSDGTSELLREYSSSNSHLRFVSEPDRGLSHAFNKGIEMASGDVIAIIGDDDYYEPGAFEIAARAFEKYPEADMIVGACGFIDNDGAKFLVAEAMYTNRRDLMAFWETWSHTVYIMHAACFVRRRVFEDIGGFDELDKYAMDYRFFIKLAAKHKIVVIPEKLANFRWDVGTISYHEARARRRECLQISRAFWHELDASELKQLKRSLLVFRVKKFGWPILKTITWPIRLPYRIWHARRTPTTTHDAQP